MSSLQGIIGVNIGNFKTYLPLDCNLFVKISLYWMLFYSKMHVDWSFWSFEGERVCEVDTTYSFCTAVPVICCCIIYRVLVCEVGMGTMWWEYRRYESMISFTVRTIMFMHCLKDEVWTDGILFIVLSDLQCDYKWCEQLQKVINKKVIDAQKLITLEFKSSSEFVHTLSKFTAFSVFHLWLIKLVLTLCQTVNVVISCDMDLQLMLQVLEDKPNVVFQHGGMLHMSSMRWQCIRMGSGIGLATSPSYFSCGLSWKIMSSFCQYLWPGITWRME